MDGKIWFKKKKVQYIRFCGLTEITQNQKYIKVERLF